MKILLTIIFSFACTHQSSLKVHQNTSKKQSNKFDYLQEFYKIKDELKIKSSSCQKYSDKTLNSLYQNFNNEYGFALLNPAEASSKYNPVHFDWDLKNKLHELYLSYQFSSDIVAEHFEISHNILDCQNEFDHYNFLKAVMGSYNLDKKNGMNILKAYFNYMFKNSTSPLSTMIMAQVTDDLYKNNIIKLNDYSKFKQEKEKLESLFTLTGQETLKYFREKNYQKIYDLATNLQSQKQSFVSYLNETLTFK
jgi:hypothetical protein